jgi:hypothetical protein
MLQDDLALLIYSFTVVELWAWLENGKVVWDESNLEWIVVAPLVGLLAVIPRQLQNGLAHASLAAFTRAFNAIGNLIAPGDGFVVKQVQTGYPSQEDDEQAPVLALPYRRMWAVEQKAKEVQVGLCNM